MSVRSRVYRERRLPAGRPLAAIIAGLWRNGEQGVWYDSSDLSTMFQDSAGTTPVYMPGQGQPDCWIGLQLDKRRGLKRGPEVLSNGDFAAGGASWGVSGADATHTVTFENGAMRYQSDTTSPQLSVAQGSVLTVGAWYEVVVTVSAWVSGALKSDSLSGVGAAPVVGSAVGTFRFIGRAIVSTFSLTRNAANTDITIDSISIRELPGNHRWQETATSRAVLSARYNLLTGTESLATQSVPVAATTYTLATGGSGSVTLSGAASGTYASGSRSITCTAGTLTLTVSGSVTQADLRSSTDGVGLPPYQRVVDASTYDTAGFPLYRKPDGVDDWMQTAAVDFSGTGKVTVATAMRKLSDAARAMLIELGTAAENTVGNFAVEAPSAGLQNLAARASGSSSVNTVQTASAIAPLSAVLLARIDSAAGVGIRINGGAWAENKTPFGGNFVNAPVYFDRRTGASLPSSARDYGTLIVGRLLTGPETAAVEKFLRQKSRAY